MHVLVNFAQQQPHPFFRNQMLTVWCLLEQDGMGVGVLASVSEKSMGAKSNPDVGLESIAQEWHQH